MGHIHTANGQYDFTVGAYIIRKSNDGYEALLHFHKKLNMWLPFGGHIELDETPWQAVLREIKEESGYEVEQLRVLQPKDTLLRLSDVEVLPQPVFIAAYDYDASHNHTDIAYAFLVNSEPNSKITDDESSIFSWYSANALDHLNSQEAFKNTIEVYKFVLTRLNSGWVADSIVSE